MSAPLSPRNASYAIDVAYDGKEHTLAGREIVRYRNLTDSPMPDLELHLYLNAFKNLESTFMRESGGMLRTDRYKKGGFGTIDIERLALVDGGIDLTSQIRFIHPDDDNDEDQTVVQVSLPATVAPGGEAEIEVQWHAKLPRVFARTGYEGTFTMVGQWFPKVGVFEEAQGSEDEPKEAHWNCHQFHANSEFYSDYGIYDVTIQADRRAVVGACGQRMGNPAERGGLSVHHYRAEDVHDFAFAADPDFRERTERWRNVDIRLLYQPEHEPLVDRHLLAAKRSLEFFDRHYGPYPYRTLTVVDPGPGASGAAGMEYPTLITAGSRRYTVSSRLFPWLLQARDLELVIIHEFGHQYWYGMVGSNEFEEAWLDEGINSYSETKALTEPFLSFFGGRLVLSDLAFERALYTFLPHEGAILQKSWLYPGMAGYGIASYMKPATVLHTLERMEGEETMGKVMRTYFERYRFRHPRSEDFFRTVEEVTGKSYQSFWDQFVRQDRSVDYAVRSLSSKLVTKQEGVYDKDGKRIEVSREEAKKARKQALRAKGDKTYRTMALFERREEGVVPVDYVVRFEDGSVEKGEWGGSERVLRREYVRSSRALVAVIDPDEKLLIDTNRANNSLFRRAGASPFQPGGLEEMAMEDAGKDKAGEAAAKERDEVKDIASRATEALSAIAQVAAQALALFL